MSSCTAPLAVFPVMARQFSADDIVRLLLNVERSVVRQALTDERLSAHEIWLEKGVILDEIRKITAPVSPREAFLQVFSEVVRAALGAALLLRQSSTGPIIGRLFRVAMDGVVFILESILTVLEELAVPPGAAPGIEEFDLVPSQPLPPQIGHDVNDLRVASQELLTVSVSLTEARDKLRELFFAIDPVFSLAQGPILGAIGVAQDARARALGEIETHITS